ncbi:MAG: tetratricopeptide repeat protein, partial [Acidobacteriota bacterium]|nr:tetratricopeptide repeat protein [Acidobacteriota bacterium]
SVVKEIALPFLKDPPNHNFLQVAGQACQALGEWEEAISYYKEHLTRLGTNINILNSIGDCYNQLGNAEEALRAYEKSLEINPGQEKIRALIKSLKETN